MVESVVSLYGSHNNNVNNSIAELKTNDPVPADECF